MSDQNGDKTAAGETKASSETSREKTPEAAAEARATAGAAPREPEAPEDEWEPPEHDDDLEDSELEDDAETPEEARSHPPENPPEPPPEKAKRRGGVVKFFAYLIVLAAAGGGGYYLWNTYLAVPETADEISAPPEPSISAPAPEQKAEAEKPIPAPETGAAPAESKTPGESADLGNKPTPAALPAAPQATKMPGTEKPASGAEPAAPAQEAAPVAAKPASESAPAAMAGGETAAPAAQAPSPSEPKPPAESAASENKPAVQPAPAAAPEKPAAAAATPEPAKAAEAMTLAPEPAPAAEPTKPAAAPATTSSGAANPQTDAALAAMAIKLAAAETTVERLSQRLQSVEGELGALKSETRAPSAREAGPDNSSEAAARLAVTQSLLSAVRQGDDYSTQIEALQKFGADPGRLARLRAGLSAPGVDVLAKQFAVLAPRLLEAAAPAKPIEQGKPPQNLQDAIWAHVAAEASKLVRIRPAGSPEQDAAAAGIAKIEKDLRAGDLMAALADRQQLPPAALSLSNDWAATVQARIDAISAAKAELAAALRNLTQIKS